MNANGTDIEPPRSFTRAVDVPRLDLPKFEFRGPALRPVPIEPVAPEPIRTFVAPEPTNVRIVPAPTPASVRVAPAPAHEMAAQPFAPVVNTAPAPRPAPSSVPSAVDPSRMTKLRSDAMLGLVVGIGFAVIAAATIVALWSKMHGVPPGTY